MKVFRQGKRAAKATINNKGSALLLVMMMSVFTMGIWAVSFRATRDAIDTETFHSQHTRFEQRIVKALAWAGQMLQEEEPEQSHYRFLFVGRDEKGKFYTTVELRRRASERFEATAHPASTSEIRRLPRNPSHF